MFLSLLDQGPEKERLPCSAYGTTEHVHASPLIGFARTEDNKCAPGTTGNIGSGPLKPDDPPFNPKTTFGHMHAGATEWWIAPTGSNARLAMGGWNIINFTNTETPGGGGQ